MKGAMTTLHKGLLPIFSAAAVLAILCLAAQSRADNIQTLTDDNSTVSIDLSSQSGMDNWNVDGNPYNYLPQQWFWYRIGPTATAKSIDTLTLGAVSNTGNSMSATYNGAGFDVVLNYKLTGGAPGSGSSDVNENIAINNLSGSPLDLHFFQFSHFKLNGLDNVTLGKATTGPNAGLYDEAYQTGGGISMNESVDTVNTPGANHGEANFYPATSTALNTVPGYQLNDNTSAGPGDVTWALEWDKVLSPMGSTNSTLLISKDKNLQVPEPSAVVLLSLGLAFGVLRRRR